MASKKKRVYKKRIQIRMGATLGFVGFVGILYNDYKALKGQGWATIAKWWFTRLTGYRWDTGKWNWRDATAAMSLGGGVLVSWLGAKSKTNKYLPTFGPISINW